jgi:pSer/pThr/pTyr-binding forkhead associated (FHA) protein
MPCLIIETEGLNKEPVTITLGNEAVIGREKSNGIYINDERASRQHAKIAKEPDGSYLLVDMGSRNGMIVNGARVSRRKLVDKDRIVIGRTTLIYNESTPAPAQASAQPATPAAAEGEPRPNARNSTYNVTSGRETLKTAADDKTIKAPADGQSAESDKRGSDALKKAISDVISSRPEDKTALDTKKTALIAAGSQKSTQAPKAPASAGGSQVADEAPSTGKRIMVFLVFLIFFVTILLFAKEITKRLLSKAEKSGSIPANVAPENARDK